MRLFRRLDLRHRAWRWSTKKDVAEIAWMRTVLAPGDVVVDAGAYKGGYAYTMRLAVGGSGAVYAFEPQPELAAFLRKAVSAFAWDNVHIVEAGLSDTISEATMHAPADGPAQTATLLLANATDADRTYTVQLESLDSFVVQRDVRRPIAFIKCDVEGHEWAALQGAKGVLREDKPRLLFECEARYEPSGSVQRVFDYVTSLGYRGFYFRNGQKTDIGEFDSARDQVPGTLPYVNLFAFEAE